MPALTNNISREYRPGDVLELPVAASSSIKQGALVMVDGANVKAAIKGAGKIYIGVAQTAANNSSGQAGDVTVTVRRRAAFLFAKKSTAALGKDAYVVDDNTVTDVTNGASKCGKIIGIDGSNVWVEIN